MPNLRQSFVIAAILCISACPARSAGANEPPADLCSLLPAAELTRTLGQAYDAPQKSVAPRPAPDSVQGTDCSYQPKEASASKVLFRTYIDPSENNSKWMFLRMSKFYSTTTAVTGLGDEAYFDDGHGLHVRKGRMRFFINLVPTANFTPDREKQVKDLAVRILAQL